MPNQTEQKSPFLICKKERIWKTDPVNIETFAVDFLGRYHSEKQLEVLKVVCGTIPEKFDLRYDELVLMVGQKGGKNYTVETLVAYYCYKLCNLVDVHKFFGIDPGVEFNICNSSMVNERQAKNVFFKRVSRAIKATIDPVSGENWFAKYAGLDLRPDGVGDVKLKEITFPGPEDRGKITFHSFDSKPQTPEGLEIILAIMDEPSRANTPILYEKAADLYKMYRGNIAGSFPNGLGKLCLFSYPEQEINDLTVSRYEKGKSEKTTFVMKASTYEFNPHRTKEMNKKAYDDDPIDAKCRFECIIPANKFGFFAPYFDKIKESISKTLKNRIKYRPSETKRTIEKDNEKIVKYFTGIEILELRGDNRPRIIAGDPGKSRDSFIIAAGYPDEYERYLQTGERKSVEIRKTDENGKEVIESFELKSKIVIDLIIVWTPGENFPVDYLDVENVLINQLLTAFPNTRGVHFDQWNSEGLRQKVIQRGIECETHNFSNPEQIKMYKILRALIWNNMFEILEKNEYVRDPKQNEAEKELRELLFVNKSKIDHPANGSKDIADVLAMIAKYCILMEVHPEMKFDSMPYELDEMVRRFKAIVKEYGKLNSGTMPDEKYIAEKLGIPVEWLPELRSYMNEIAMTGKDLNDVLPEGY